MREIRGLRKKIKRKELKIIETRKKTKTKNKTVRQSEYL